MNSALSSEELRSHEAGREGDAPASEHVIYQKETRNLDIKKHLEQI